MIDPDDLRVAELETLAELGTASGSVVAERLGQQTQRVSADLARLAKKGLVIQVTGYALTDEGQKLLEAVASIKRVFPGRGNHAKGNGETE